MIVFLSSLLLHLLDKGVPYYENRITKEKTYVRPLNVKISGIKLVYPSKGGVDNNVWILSLVLLLVLW